MKNRPLLSSKLITSIKNWKQKFKNDIFHIEHGMTLTVKMPKFSEDHVFCFCGTGLSFFWNLWNSGQTLQNNFKRCLVITSEIKKS